MNSFGFQVIAFLLLLIFVGPFIGGLIAAPHDNSLKGPLAGMLVVFAAYFFSYVILILFYITGGVVAFIVAPLMLLIEWIRPDSQENGYDVIVSSCLIFGWITSGFVTGALIDRKKQSRKNGNGVALLRAYPWVYCFFW